MRILAFSDLHRDKCATLAIMAEAGAADVMVGAGDFATRGAGLADCIEILKRSPAPVVLTPGNHETHDDILRLCADCPHIHVLHGSGATIGGLRFFGLGYEIPSGNPERWNRALPEEAAAGGFDSAGPFDILVTHTPPFGCADIQRDGTREGSRSILAALEMHKPRFHFCGHIHHSWGAEGVVGETFVKNLGPTINWFDA